MSQWDDQGIVLSLRPHGETAAIVTCLTEDHGRNAGYVHAARSSKKLRGILQPGNLVALHWNARNDSELGAYSMELDQSVSGGVMDDPMRLGAVASSCALLDMVLPEREMHPELYHGTLAWFSSLDSEAWAPAYIMWELRLLSALGFAVDLEKCAATGATEKLTHVSPKSGCAVSAEAAEPYQHKLLPLPGFLVGSGEWEDEDIANGLRLTGYFLFHRVLDPLSKTIPDVRERLFKGFAPLHDEEMPAT